MMRFLKFIVPIGKFFGVMAPDPVKQAPADDSPYGKIAPFEEQKDIQFLTRTAVGAAEMGISGHSPIVVDTSTLLSGQRTSRGASGQTARSVSAASLIDSAPDTSYR